MWPSFGAACVIGALLLYLPGFLLLRALGNRAFVSAAFAPAPSVVLLCAVGIIYSKFGVFADWVTVGAAVVLLPLVVIVVEAALCKLRGVRVLDTRRSDNAKSFLLAGGLCLVVSCAVTAYVYVKGLNGADSIVQSYDNVFHYNVANSFLRSGEWSVLQVGCYLDVDPEMAAFGNSGFYPAAWHCLVACVASTGIATLPVAANAVNTVLIAAVFPISCMGLLHLVFKDARILFVLSPLCLAFGAFPWMLYSGWPLFPNAAAMAFLPLAVGSVVFLLDDGPKLKLGIPIFILCFAAEGFLQPNGIFSAAVISAPFVIRACYLLCRRFGRSAAVAASVSALLAVLFAVAWVFVAGAPAMQGTVGYYWPPIQSTARAAFSLISQGVATLPESWFVGALVVVGALVALLGNRQRLWMVISFAICGILYVVAASFEDVPLKHILTGFWYTDPYRLAAVLVVPSLLLAAETCVALMHVALKVLGDTRTARLGSTVVVVIALVVGCFIQPFTFVRTVKDLVTVQNLNDYNYYNGAERDFVEQAKTIVPEGATVLNMPFDGSVFAYAEDDLNVYYRLKSGFAEDTDSDDSREIRKGAASFADSQNVADAFRESGIEYVILFNSKTHNYEPTFDTYFEEDWRGLATINEDTRGFQLVCESGDMRLFKVDYSAAA